MLFRVIEIMLMESMITTNNVIVIIRINITIGLFVNDVFGWFFIVSLCIFDSIIILAFIVD